MRLIAVLSLAVTSQAATNTQTTTSLFDAVPNNDLAFLRQHLTPDNVNARDDRQSTLLMYAAVFGGPEAMRMLIAAGADVNAENASRTTALVAESEGQR